MAVKSKRERNDGFIANYSWALEQLKAGEVVTRKGWNGKGMFLFYVEGEDKLVSDFECPALEGEVIFHRPYVAMKDVQGHVVAWLCSQTDALADDWGYYEAD